MKKKMITVLMTAMMIISLAACGGKDAEESVPGNNSVAQDENSGSEESEANDQTEESQPEEINTTEPSEESSEEAPTEADDISEEVKQWAASVDWNRVVYTHFDDSTELMFYLLVAINNANENESIEDAVNNYLEMTRIYEDEEDVITYEKDIDDDAKAVLDKYVSLNRDERRYVYEYAAESLDKDSESQTDNSTSSSEDSSPADLAVNEELDAWIASIDWDHEYCTVPKNEYHDEYNDTIRSLPILYFQAELKQITVEENINDWLSSVNSEMTYEKMDEYSKQVLEKIAALSYDELSYVMDTVNAN